MKGPSAPPGKRRKFAPIADPEGLAARLDAIPGVVGHGLFLGMADLVIAAAADGALTRLEPTPGTAARPS
ncbi:MAG: ribose-5-phosphate isomerase A [Candidatus Dormibacteraeota bacterium]|uniref:Ribose-5-phosphate isomerase A n=1 Tax=Candidatus Aeolococcus gillhamiae TaxID=3127015 RepID=A0A934MZP9_9BACT|nr:ribose-5-phosphate isomerase A [Candidatus Dormibacteraeota bacterium]